MPTRTRRVTLGRRIETYRPSRAGLDGGGPSSASLILLLPDHPIDAVNLATDPVLELAVDQGQQPRNDQWAVRYVLHTRAAD